MRRTNQPSRWSRAQGQLRFRMLVTHVAVALSATATFLIVAVALEALVPSPAGQSAAGSPRTMLIVATSAALGLAVSALLAGVVARRLFVSIVTPVRRATTVARRLAKGHYSERVTPHETRTGALGGPGQNSYDEDTAALAASINELATSLESSERQRTLSFGEVAHEIRTPVAVLEGYLEGLLDGHVKPSEKTWAMLYDEASRVHRLVDELQALSHAENRQSLPDLQAVDPAEVAQGALDRLRLHFNEKGLQVTTDLEMGLPLVLADPDQALQALVNLLTNALRYTPTPGQVTLSVISLEGANEVVFRVKDTGVGIAAEHIPHLFERFFRVDRGGNRKVGGSGIGLPVAKALVEAMGGRIWAESPGIGQGSTFSFTLLIAPDAPLT